MANQGPARPWPQPQNVQSEADEMITTELRQKSDDLHR